MKNRHTQTQIRYQSIKKTTLISALFNLIFSLSKITIGIVGHSSALFADGIHSFSDLLGDAIVFLGAYLGKKPPDSDHPYGHHRIETLFSIFISITMIIVGLSLAYNMIHDLMHPSHTTIPALSVLLTALFSMLANEGLFRYINRVGKKLQSTLLISHAWHHRTDVYVSLLVIVSIVGSAFHIPYLDAGAALIIAMLIIKVGAKLIIDSLKELIDTAVDENTTTSIRNFIKAIPGVISIHELRTRLHANMIILDVHIQVNPKISVSEGHYIAAQIKARLIKQITNVQDVMVHIDPEDDEKRTTLTQFAESNEHYQKIKKNFSTTRSAHKF